MRLPFVIHITRKNARSVFTKDRAFLFYVTPTHRLSEKSRREQKSLYPTTGATTDSQSSLGVLLLLRQSPPTTSVCKGILRAHSRCLPAKVHSVRISGVCLQWCIRCASQVFVCNGVFGAHLRCLPARVFSGCISGVCLQRCIRCASQVFAIDGNGHRPCKRLWHSQPFLT